MPGEQSDTRPSDGAMPRGEPAGDPSRDGDSGGRSPDVFGEPRNDGIVDLRSGSAGQGDPGAQDPEVGTRDRIVQAAAEVFLEKGFTGTRVVDIARRAGFTSGALYGYFDSRAELLAEAVARASSQMLSRLLGAETAADGTYSEVADDDAMAVLKLALDRIAHPIDESEQMLLDGIALAHREPVAGERLAHTIDQFRSELAKDHNGRLGEPAADMLVVLVLGITAARALGWHDAPSSEMRGHIEACLLEASKTSLPGTAE